jgi:hypothetical protein
VWAASGKSASDTTVGSDQDSDVADLFRGLWGWFVAVRPFFHVYQCYVGLRSGSMALITHLGAAT